MYFSFLQLSHSGKHLYASIINKSFGALDFDVGRGLWHGADISTFLLPQKPSKPQHQTGRRNQ
jgi:hypothetical protein